MDDQTAETKVCPECAESVKAEARVCRFCGYRFDGAPSATTAASWTAPTAGRRRGFLFWALASAGFMTIGSFGPWIGAFGASVAGTDGSNDGWLVVAAAVIGAVCLAATRNYRGGGLWALLGGVIASIVTIYDRSHASHLIGRQSALVQAVVHIGWGLNLAMVASISFALCGAVWLLAVGNAPGLGEARPTSET